MKALIKRNILLFCHDKTAVFFSFMAVFVVLALYVSFLGEMMMEPLKEQFPNTAREISDTWIIAGTLGIVSLTTSLSVLGIRIDDKSKGIWNDFEISPLSTLQLHMAYVFSTILITCVVSLITLSVGQLYIVAYGGRWLSFATIIKLMGIMLLSTITCTSIQYFFLSFFKTTTSFSNITTIIGTLSGFLMGIYVPIGILPKPLQTCIALFPPSHGALLYRRVMMQDVLNRSFPGDVAIEFQENFGLVFRYGSDTTTMLDSVLMLGITCLVFFVCIRFRKRK